MLYFVGGGEQVSPTLGNPNDPASQKEKPTFSSNNQAKEASSFPTTGSLARLHLQPPEAGEDHVARNRERIPVFVLFSLFFCPPSPGLFPVFPRLSQFPTKQPPYPPWCFNLQGGSLMGKKIHSVLYCFPLVIFACRRESHFLESMAILQQGRARHAPFPYSDDGHFEFSVSAD